MKKKEDNKVKTSLYLPSRYIQALKVIFSVERIRHSDQFELALKQYFKQYSAVLKDHDITI